MTPGLLSPRSEFSPVPSHGSIFVYMIPPQNGMPARVTPVLVPGREFHSGTKSRSGIIYSYLEKGCRRKCTRQSRKVLWVVLSSLFFKES